MKNLTIFTDPHLGTKRQAHTTRESSKRLQEQLYFQAMSIVSSAVHPVLCNGDLFDRSMNSEAILVQGYDVASKCWMTVAGNHDETNMLGSVTSLSALGSVGVNVCAAPDLTNPFWFNKESIYIVPHHASQEVFEQAMREAAHHAVETRDGLASYIFLHCNYQFGLATEDNTLNLTAEMTDVLCEAFDYVFLGHEHNPTTHRDGKVVILGNTHPTSFSDISDKNVYHLELETATLTKELIWSKAEHYLELKVGQAIPDLAGIHFIDVKGVEGVSEASVVSQYIQDVWKAAQYQACGTPGTDLQDCCDLLAVRNSVQLKDALADVDDEVSVKVEDLRSRIAADLEGSDLKPLYQELVAEVEA